MFSDVLPLFLSLEDVQDLSKRSRAVLRQAWDLGVDDPKGRTRAYHCILNFLNKIDPYTDSALPKFPHDSQLFHAHNAQAFRHACMILFESLPSCLDALGHVRFLGDVLDSIRLTSNAALHSMEAAVKLANTLRGKGNEIVGKQIYTDAVETYMFGLASLVPFSSDDTIMTFEQSGAVGLRQIEESLLTNIMVTAHKAAAGKKKSSKTWASIFQLALTCLENHPHATFGGAIKRTKLHKESIEKYRSSWDRAAISRFESRRAVVEVWKRSPPQNALHARFGSE